MKKFSFSLQKVLEIKEQVLENLKIKLSNLNHELKAIEEKIKNLNAKYQSVENEFVEKSSIAISVGEMTYYKMYISSILKQIEKHEEEKEAVIKKIEAKRYEILSMNKEISSLEKLRENDQARATARTGAGRRVLSGPHKHHKKGHDRRPAAH